MKLLNSVNRYYCIALTTILFSIVIESSAQSGTNSPYSQFGFGELSNQASSFNNGMSGLSYGLRDHNQVNILQPASYSALDSLTFIFDVGASLQITNFEEGGKRINAKNGDLEHAIGAFRAAKNLGVSFGIIPFSNIGYNYSVGGFAQKGDNITTDAYHTVSYNGTGGLHEIFVGAGWKPFGGLSFGANIGMLWGSYNRTVMSEFSDNYSKTTSKEYSADITSYKLDLGLQYIYNIDSKNSINLGAVFGLGHKLGADPECKVISSNSQTAVSDTTKYVIENGLSLPMTFGAGFAFNHNQKWRVGIDYSLQKWGDVKFPEYTSKGYVLSSNYFKNRSRYTLGGEYCQNSESRKFFDRIRYRLGMSYATPYYKIGGQEGPKEISASIGFGLPIVNSYNNRSILNISAQWVNSSAQNLIKENTFRINIGFTFNERWFMKWKLD